MNKYELFLNYFYEIVNYIKNKFNYVIDFCNNYNLINTDTIQVILTLILFICLLKLIKITKNLNGLKEFPNNNSNEQYKISFKTIDNTYISLNFTFDEIMKIFLNPKIRKKNICLSLYKNTYINLWDDIIVHNGIKFTLDERNGIYCHIDCFINSLGKYKDNFMILLELDSIIIKNINNNKSCFYLLRKNNGSLKEINNFKIDEINTDKAKLNIIVNNIEEINFNINHKDDIEKVRKFFNC